MITSLQGSSACPLGLAAHPHQPQRCVGRAFDQGINYFFFYGPGHKSFIQGLAPLVRRHREELIVATGSGARKPGSLRTARRKTLAALGAEMLDVFFAEYINPADDPEAVFGRDGVLDELQKWKAEGSIRFVGATAHDRPLARRLAEDHRVDILMHRFNMAHRKAMDEVFPAALAAQTPVVAFTATRWGTLLESPAQWPEQPPRAADCYRYCLAHPAVQVVLTAPQSLTELEANLGVLRSTPMSAQDRMHWEQFGDVVRAAGKGAFETRWP
jgi:aryl-alcohol dehydrogenase-like predicted oxidoreductase